MAEQIDSLLVNLGLETDAESFQKAESQFDSLKSTALQFGAVIGAGFGLNELTFGFAEATNEANKLAQEFDGLGVTPQFVSQLRGAFRLIDEDGSEAESTIRRMADLIEETDWGEISDAAFARGLDISGIQEAETAAEAMAALNEQMRGMDTRQARELGQALGLSSAQIRMFRDFDIGSRMGQAGEFAPMTDEMSEAAAEFTEGWNQLSEAMTGLQREVSATFVGDLGENLSDLAGYMKDNRDEIREFTESALPYLRNTAAALGALVAIQSARSSLGIFRNVPFLTGAAAVAGTYIWENAGIDDDARGPPPEEQVGAQRSRMDRMNNMPDDLTIDEQRRWMRGEPVQNSYTVNVDARNANNPAEVQAAAERGAITALRRISENGVRDFDSTTE